LNKKWLLGQSNEEIAPHLVAWIPKHRANKRIVLEAMTNQ